MDVPNRGDVRKCWGRRREAEGHRLHVRFRDGVEGTLEWAKVTHFQGVFAPLEDPAYFRTLRVNPELGTIQWDNGADVAPEVLYGLVAERTLE